MPLEIQWFGGGCFRLRGSQGTVVCDPYPLDSSLPPNFKADVITLSRPDGTSGLRLPRQAEAFVIDGPGEYERGGIFVVGLAIGQRSAEASVSSSSIAYAITIDDVTVCHLGELGRRPTQAEVEVLGSVDVLLVPIGGGMMLNAARAAEVVGLIDPKIAVPMHYPVTPAGTSDALDRFLKEIGISCTAPQDALRVTSGRLPEEMQVVVLQQRG